MLKRLKLDPKYLDDENIVAKLQLIMQLEKVSPYAKGSVFDPLPERLLRALRAIPQQHQQYVLALFANVFYCTEQFSTSIMLHLYKAILREFKIRHDEFAKDCLVLEIDPTGMINDFLRLNKVQGRLDRNSFPREQQLDGFANKLFLCKGIDGFIAKQNDEDVKKYLDNIIIQAKLRDYDKLDRKYWVVLTDNVLSGTSLYSSLNRLLDLAKNFSKTPTIIILIRTLTKDTLVKLQSDFSGEINKNQLYIKYGLLLKEEYAIKKDKYGNLKKCTLFNREETSAKILEASDWLAENSGYKDDGNLRDHKINSGDDMRYGFKKCGLTFVSAENCPSNSLPLLWYKNDNLYVAPFPRVLSRIGGSSNGKN